MASVKPHTAIDSWKMTGGTDAPLFAEYLELAHAAGWGDLMRGETLQIGAHDALVVVDMQNDFIPTDNVNPNGGAFAVPEGGNIAPLIVKMMEHFGAQGATVIPTRDYHPNDHCSFIPNGGIFPPHCIQGGVGSKFYKPIGKCVSDLRNLGKSVEVVFKGFHENVDSFGSFEYPDNSASWTRVSNKDVPERLHGCTLAAWTGAVCLKCSNIDDDIDAPPDVLSVHRRTSLADLLKEKGITRVFACGLAMDFCVLDTCLNSVNLGFASVYMILDAARPAHLPGIGPVGTGFLQDPVELKKKMVNAKVNLCPAAALLPNSSVQSPLAYQKVGQVFPENLGPWALIPARALQLTMDLASNRYTATAPAEALQSLRNFGVEPVGSTAPKVPITLDAKTREQLKIPSNAKSFLWAYPVAEGSSNEQSRGYFGITSPSAAFLTYGGYVYLDAADKVVATMAVAIGQGLAFGKPQKWSAKYTPTLAGRWQPVTAPLLRRKGACLFAWINPGEVLSGGGDIPSWKVCNHGAFAYLFHEDLAAEDDRDVFFEVGTTKLEHSSSLGRIGHVEGGSVGDRPSSTAAQSSDKKQSCCSCM